MNDSNARLTRRELLASSLMTSVAATLAGSGAAVAQPLTHFVAFAQVWPLGNIAQVRQRGIIDPHCFRRVRAPKSNP